MRLPVLFFLLLCLGCQSKEPPEIAVYHWSSQLDDWDMNELREKNPFNLLYVRLFDVKWHPDYGAYPEAHVNSYYHDDSTMQFIPVVYITNESLVLTPEDSLPQLFKRLKEEIDHVWKNNLRQEKSFKELQFDCDWTDRSRDKYFALLRYFTEADNYRVSCTVKMYQYAYREKAGIPPADKAVLMCYNLSSPRNYKEVNSIFTVEEAKKYLTRNDYPLPLDFALPVFSWGVVFRNGVFLGLEHSFEQNREYWPLKAIDSTHYVFTRDHSGYWDDAFYKKGDILRYEKAGPSEFNGLKDELPRHYNQKNTRIILFDIDHLKYTEHANDSLCFSRMRTDFTY